MRRCSRRDFLQWGGKAALTTGAAPILGGCPSTTLPPVPYAPYQNPAKVTAILGMDLVKMTLEALESIGGIETVVNPGDTVFIKPNFVGADFARHNVITSGDCTKPEIVITVAEACLKAGASKVTIGDGAQVETFSWEALTTLDGSSSMAAEAARLSAQYGDKLQLACLNADTPEWDPIPSPCTKLGSILVSSLVTRADRVISLPVMKTHRFTQTTGSLKNFVGITPLKHYSSVGGMMRDKFHHNGLEQSFLDIVKAIRPHFTIMDMSVCCEGDGPHVLPGWWGSTVDTRSYLGKWLLLAGRDLPSVDATATRIIEHEPAQVTHLVMAHDQGLGQTEKDRITLEGANLDALFMSWKAAKPAKGFGDVLIPGIALLLAR